MLSTEANFKPICYASSQSITRLILLCTAYDPTGHTTDGSIATAFPSSPTGVECGDASRDFRTYLLSFVFPLFSSWKRPSFLQTGSSAMVENSNGGHGEQFTYNLSLKTVFQDVAHEHLQGEELRMCSHFHHSYNIWSKTKNILSPCRLAQQQTSLHFNTDLAHQRRRNFWSPLTARGVKNK